MSGSNKYKNDSLRMTNRTTVSEIKEFLRRRIRQPYHVQDTTVWNFSNHSIEHDALEEGVEGKLERDRYVIPFQVTGSFAMFFQLLPEVIQQAEILVYKPDFEEYSAYSNFLREMGDETNEFREEMEEELDSMGIVE